MTPSKEPSELLKKSPSKQYPTIKDTKRQFDQTALQSQSL